MMDSMDATIMRKHISEKVNRYLAQNEMTGAQLAENAKVHPNTVTNCRSGIGLPLLHTAYRLARAMDMTLDELTGMQ